MKTNKEVIVIRNEGTYTVPKGIEVMLVNPMGNIFYAVAHIEDCIKCGMAQYYAEHYYLFIPENAIDKEGLSI